MVSRDSRRALTGNRHYRSPRVAVRRSVMPHDGSGDANLTDGRGEWPELVDETDEPAEPAEPAEKDEKDEGARVRTARPPGTSRHRRARDWPGRRRLTVWVATVVAVCAL